MVKKQRVSLKKWEYGIGFLSILPIVGFVFGLVAVVLGALKVRSDGWKLISTAIVGMAVSVSLLSWLPSFLFSLHDKNISHDVEKELEKRDLFKNVETIEYFHLTRGRYPDSFDDLKKCDPEAEVLETGELEKQHFHYELVDNKSHYYLFGVGKTGIPFTGDDVLPDVPANDLDKIGYRPRPLGVLTPGVTPQNQGK